MRTRIATILSRIIRGGLFCTPLLVLFFTPSLPYPFVTGRHFLFRVVIEFLVVLWLALIALDGAYKPRFTRTTKAFLFFLGVVALADIFGVDPERSFWSNYRRMEGMLALLHFGAYFLLLQNFFRRDREWRIFFRLVVAVGFTVSAIALLQRVGSFPFLAGDQLRTSTIGNTSLLSAFLLLYTFIALLLLLKTRRTIIRCVYAMCITLALVAIFFVSTRAVLLALYVVFFLFSAGAVWRLWWVPHFNLLRVFFVIALFVFIASPFFFFAARATPTVQENRSLAHFTEVDATLGARTTLWKIAWNAFLERPFFGWGQENYLIAYSRHHDPSLFYFESRWFDRPHNVFIEWLVNAGFLGLLAYCGLFYAAYRGLWETVRRGVRPWREGIALGAALLAYIIQNLFVFDSFGTYLLFFALLAYSDMPLLPEPLASRVHRTAHTALYGACALLFVMLFVVAAPALFIRPILAGEALVAAVRLWHRKRPLPLVQEFFERALAFRAFDTEEIRMSLIAPVAAGVMQDKSYDSEAIASFLHFAFREAEYEVWRQPANLRVFSVLSAVYRIAGRTDSVYLERAAMILAEARRLFPSNQYIIFEDAWTRLTRQERALALDAAKEGVAIDPTIAKSVVQLALIAIHAGDRDREAEALVQLFSEGDPDTSSLVSLAGAYIAVGRFRDATPLYRTVVVREKGQAQHYLNLLENEWRDGRKEVAQRLADTLVRRYPEYREKLPFSLDGGRPILKGPLQKSVVAPFRVRNAPITFADA